MIDRGVYPDSDFGLNNLAIPETLNKQSYWYRVEFETPREAVGHHLTFSILPPASATTTFTLLPGESRTIIIHYPELSSTAPKIALRGWNIDPAIIPVSSFERRHEAPAPK